MKPAVYVRALDAKLSHASFLKVMH